MEIFVGTNTLQFDVDSFGLFFFLLNWKNKIQFLNFQSLWLGPNHTEKAPAKMTEYKRGERKKKTFMTFCLEPRKSTDSLRFIRIAYLD